MNTFQTDPTLTTPADRDDFWAWLWAGEPTEAERQAEFNAWLWEAAPPPAPTVVDC